MTNVTIALDDTLLNESRTYAKTHHTTLNKLIRTFLTKTVKPTQTIKKNTLNEMFSMMDKAKASSKGKKWTREDLYDV